MWIFKKLRIASPPYCDEKKTMPEQLVRRRPITTPNRLSDTNNGRRSEYSQAYSSAVEKQRPKPRNPQQSWSNRNRSNNIILSQENKKTTSVVPRRKATQRRHLWAWQERDTLQEIFSDKNNNPSIRPQRQINTWPWQIRSRSSSILCFNKIMDPENDNSNQRTPVKWPWQERAMTSLIFDQPEEKQTPTKDYQWDQRKCNSFFGEDQTVNESQQQQQRPENMVEHESESKTSKGNKNWPWQEKARESNIFKSAEVETYQGRKYPWDQRRTTYDVRHTAPSVVTNNNSHQFIKSSTQYSNDSHLKNKKKSSLDASALPPAGKRCYGTENFDVGLLDDGSSPYGKVKTRTPQKMTGKITGEDSTFKKSPGGGSVPVQKSALSASKTKLNESGDIDGKRQLDRKETFTVLNNQDSEESLKNQMQNMNLNSNQQQQHSDSSKVKDEFLGDPIAKISIAAANGGKASHMPSNHGIVDLD